MNFTRCAECRNRITFFGSPFGGDPRPFEPKEVDSRTYPGIAYPVMSGRAYRFVDLVDRLMPQRQESQEVVEDEVRDLPWHVLHECHGSTDQADDEGSH